MLAILATSKSGIIACCMRRSYRPALTFRGSTGRPKVAKAKWLSLVASNARGPARRLAVRRSEAKAFAAEATDFEIRNHFYGF
jgi:hypothetical protein